MRCPQQRPATLRPTSPRTEQPHNAWLHGHRRALPLGRETDAPLLLRFDGGSTRRSPIDSLPQQRKVATPQTYPTMGGHGTGGGNTREVSEGVINGLLLVSNVMNTPSANEVGGRLPPIQHAPSVGNTQAVVSSLGRALLGGSGTSAASSSVLPAIAAASVPSFAVDEHQVAQTEMDTAVALLLLLHKRRRRLSSAELGVRQSAPFMNTNTVVWLQMLPWCPVRTTSWGRLAKLLVEEEEDRTNCSSSSATSLACMSNGSNGWNIS